MSSMLLSRTIFAGISAGNRMHFSNLLPIKYKTNSLVLYYNSDLADNGDNKSDATIAAKSCHKLIEYYNDDLNSDLEKKLEKKQKYNRKCYKLAEYYNSDAQ
jgi:hypothetical protein